MVSNETRAARQDAHAAVVDHKVQENNGKGFQNQIFEKKDDKTTKIIRNS